MQNISYEDLASNDFKNKIAIRSSSNIYNQSLIASLIYHNGESKTKKWLKGFVSNFSLVIKNSTFNFLFLVNACLKK